MDEVGGWVPHFFSPSRLWHGGHLKVFLALVSYLSPGFWFFQRQCGVAQAFQVSVVCLVSFSLRVFV